MVFIPLSVVILVLSISVIVFITNNLISNLTVMSISWMSNWNSSAVCQVWMVNGISMEWHVGSVVDILLPVVSVLMWLKILVEVLVSSVSYMVK